MCLLVVYGWFLVGWERGVYWTKYCISLFFCRYVRVNHTDNLHAKTISSYIQQVIKNIKYLDLANCYWMTSSSLVKSVTAKCNGIVKLDLRNCCSHGTGWVQKSATLLDWDSSRPSTWQPSLIMVDLIKELRTKHVQKVSGLSWNSTTPEHAHLCLICSTTILIGPFKVQRETRSSRRAV